MIRSALSRRSEAALYAAATLSYVAAGIAYRGLLNWVVGPLWLIAWIEVGARVANARARRREAVLTR